MDPLLPSFRRQLRARAHALHPVVSIGQQGLTDSVLHEIDIALTAHELIKVRVFNDDRRQRESMLGRIAHALDCAPIQQIGKLLVLWRPRPVPNAEDRSQSERPRRENGRHSPAAPRRRRAVGAPSATPTGKARARTPAPATSDATRIPRKAGKAPAGVPRATSRRRRRAP